MKPLNHICAVIPTYNNAGTIADVVRRVYAQMDNIIVVADGPTDNTLNELGALGLPITIVLYSKNAGKGTALKRGFEKARQMGFTHVLTIDADGQHYPEDIPALYRMHTLHPDSIIVGSRGLRQANMPGKNTFANKFSNFWFALQTGLRLPDTQTGFRIYPLAQIRGERFMTSRYEAELELLVFSAWAEVDIIPVSVRVFYPPKEERVSHFRPAYDFARISLLNTVLCLLALVYGLPRRWWRSVCYGLYFVFFICFCVYPVLWFMQLRYGDSEEMHVRLHKLVKRLATLLLAPIPFVTRRVRTVEGATPINEQQPCIMVANHSSYLDILLMMNMHEKMALVSRPGIPDNLFIGRLARNFDVLAASDSPEKMLAAVREKVEKGYSIMIFPEGTRSAFGELMRFHRGAFYLAEQLQLPIRPILLRGTADVLRKHVHHFGRYPEMTALVLPEIMPEDSRFGAGYAERTRTIRAYFHERLDVFAYPYEE